MKNNPAQEIIESMQILIDNSMKKTTVIDSGIITAINNNGKYYVKIRGKTNCFPVYPRSVRLSIGDTVYAVIPQGQHSQGFILPSSINNIYNKFTIIDKNIDSTTTPLSDIYGDGFYINDINNKPICKINAVSLSTGEDGVIFSAIKNINGTNYSNSLGLFIDKNGNSSIKISNPNAWKTALEIS